MQLASLALWKTLKPGSRIILKDAASLQTDINGITYEMVRSIEVPEDRGLMTWLFIELSGPKGESRWLMIKNVDQQTDVRIYDRPVDFEAGNRADMMDRGTLWLFQEPDDKDNVVLNNLVFTMTFQWPQEVAMPDFGTVATAGTAYQRTKAAIQKFETALSALAAGESVVAAGIDPQVHQASIDGLKSQLADLRQQAAKYEAAVRPPVLYRKKAQHRGGADMAGTPIERPRPSGDFPRQLATVTEYIGDKGPDGSELQNPEAVLLEVGPADDDNGGLIWLLIGHALELGDVDVMAV